MADDVDVELVALVAPPNAKSFVSENRFRFVLIFGFYLFRNKTKENLNTYRDFEHRL